MMSTTLVLLSYNERESLEGLIDRIPYGEFETVLAVDGGSDDGTLDLYRQRGIRCIGQPARGRGNAFRIALAEADTDHIVFFSTDGNEDPSDLSGIGRYLSEGYDMVVAGRYVLTGAATDDSDDPLRIRKFAGVAGGWLVRVLWSGGVYDAINGLRGYRVSSMRAMKLDATGHDIELQTTIRAAKLGMRVKEFPTKELPRIGGRRKQSAATLSLLVHLGGTLLKELFNGKPS